ncbi:MAG: methyltransferase [Candidatus Levybacteria bacterium]|nr:methyltransferase [Candidatus Levybacteria bacterium]
MNSATFNLQNNSVWRKVEYKNITVCYLPQIDGGGRYFSQEFIMAIREKIGRVDSICEFGSGPGFIGFSLLAYGLCNKLCLIDINPLAVKACKETIRINNLEKKVKIYKSDVLKNIPKNEKWDLVVSNPPHFNGSLTGNKEDILYIDNDWSIHKFFYSDISKHLNSNGSVLFIENSQGSSPSMFTEMIGKGGLFLAETFQYRPGFFNVLLLNVRVFLQIWKLNKIRYIISLLSRKSILVSNVLTFSKYPYYFIWSKKLHR